MKVLYFVMGLLVGMYFSGRAANIVFDNLVSTFADEYVAYRLTSYDSGWRMGRMYTEDKYRWFIGMYYNEKERIGAK